MKLKLRISVMLLLTMVIFVWGCPAKQPGKKLNLDEAKKTIAESNAIYFESFAKNDSSIFIERYAEDCCMMLPNAPAMCGPDAALQFFRMAHDNIGLRNGKFITTGIYETGKEFVVETGLWQSFNASNNIFDDGKFLVLWKKTAKGWKMFRDSFSSNHASAK